MKLRLAIYCLAVLLAGCNLTSVLQPAKDPWQFYVLTPIDDTSRGVPITYSSSARAKANLTIGLGPVKMPAYIQRPEIVTRSSSNQIDLSDRDRWAEPVDQNFVRVLGQNMTTLLGTPVVTYPWYRPAKFDYQITDEVWRFDTDSHGTAFVEGRWEIKDPNTDEVFNSGETHLSVSPEPGESAAATLSHALGDMSSQLAGAVRATRRPSPRPQPG